MRERRARTSSGVAPNCSRNAVLKAPAAVAAFEAAALVGGYATLFRHHTDAADIFTPLAPPLLRLHRELKRVFDPAGILNPGRMYADL